MLRLIRATTRYTFSFCVFVLALRTTLDLFPGLGADLAILTWPIEHSSFLSLWSIREKWATDHPFEGAFLSLIPPFLVTTLIAVLTQIGRMGVARFNPTPIDVYLRASRVVHIVYPRIDGLAFEHIGEQQHRIVLPTNTPLLPYGDARAGVLIASYVERKYAGRVKVLVHHGGDARVDRSEPIICIGGPAVNAMTNRLMKLEHVEDFSLTRDWKIIDKGISYEAKRDGTAPDAPVLEDYGVTLCINVPNTNQQRIAMIFGIWPFGTLAAAHLFTGDISPKSPMLKFARAVRRRKDVLAITGALNVGQPHFSISVLAQRKVRTKPVIAGQRWPTT